MSLLGKIIRDYLSTQTGYGTNLPGGIHPEQAPQGSSLPFAVTTGSSRTRQMHMDGTPAVSTEVVEMTIVAMTRGGAQTSADWVKAAIQASPARQTIGSTIVHHWRIENESDESQAFADGSDEQARLTTITIVGTMEGG